MNQQAASTVYLLHAQAEGVFNTLDSSTRENAAAFLDKLARQQVPEGLPTDYTLSRPDGGTEQAYTANRAGLDFIYTRPADQPLEVHQITYNAREAAEDEPVTRAPEPRMFLSHDAWDEWRREHFGPEPNSAPGDGRHLLVLEMEGPDGLHTAYMRSDTEPPDDNDVAETVASYVAGFMFHRNHGIAPVYRIYGVQVGFGIKPRRKNKKPHLVLQHPKTADRFRALTNMTIVSGLQILPHAKYDDEGAVYFPPRVVRQDDGSIRLRVGLNRGYSKPAAPGIELKVPRDYDVYTPTLDAPHYIHPVLADHDFKSAIIAFIKGVPEENLLPDGQGGFVLINMAARVAGVGKSALRLKPIPLELGHYVED